MTSLILRNSSPGSLSRRAWPSSAPFDDLFSWEPFAGARYLLDRAFVSFAPPIEVKETANEYRFSVDLPGVEEKDIDITVEGDRLSIHGKREAEAHHEDATYHAYERSYGSFTRTFTLPPAADADRGEASLRNGVLTITVPRRESHRPRKISLNSIGEKLKGMLSGKSKSDG